MTLRLAFGLCLVGFVVSCAPAPAPISRSAHDPSNPDAAEGTTPTVANASTVSTTTHDAPHATVYECPMHPEVTSPNPGTCPKCKMKLVPKK